VDLEIWGLLQHSFVVYLIDRGIIMSMGNIRESLLSGYEEEQLRRQEQRENFLRENRRLGADFSNIYDLTKPNPTQIRRRYADQLSPYPSLLNPTRVQDQEAMLDNSLLAQGLPTIGNYQPSPYITSVAGGSGLGGGYGQDKPPSEKAISGIEDLTDEQRAVIEDAAVPTPQESIGIQDSGVVSPEDFIQDAYSQYGEPATAFPIPERSKEEKEATKSRFAGLSDIFDNKEALGKIALGIALLEGTPMTEAFALYKEFGSGEVMQVELYDNELGRVVDVGSEDNARILAKYREDPNRYSIGPINSHRSAKSERDDELAAAIRDLDIDTLKKEILPRKYDAQNQLSSAEQLMTILNDPNFKSGIGSEFKLKFTRLGQLLDIGDDETVNQQVLFQRVVSKLVPTMREPGSGSTSDFEIELYKLATAGLDLTPEQNRMFVEQMIYYNKMQIARANYAQRSVTQGGSLIDAEEDFTQLINRATNSSYTTDADNYDYTEDELEIINNVFGGIPIDEESAKDIDFLQSLQDKYGTDVNFEVTRRLPKTR
jgi:hypothetical protein